MNAGRVYLIGAGPGDPGLLTLRGKELLARADVVVYDYLVSPRLLEYAPARAERIYVGKRAGTHTLSQEEINRLLVTRGKSGGTVVRLKGGDPFVFGRGGEEALALAEAGIPFEVVPGVTSGIAAPAYAGIPVTHRQLASGVGLLTGHEAPEQGGILAGLARPGELERDALVLHGHGEPRPALRKARRRRTRSADSRRGNPLGHDALSAGRDRDGPVARGRGAFGRARAAGDGGDRSRGRAPGEAELVRAPSALRAADRRHARARAGLGVRRAPRRAGRAR